MVWHKVNYALFSCAKINSENNAYNHVIKSQKLNFKDNFNASSE
jgi:hypothetical protein